MGRSKRESSLLSIADSKPHVYELEPGWTRLWGMFLMVVHTIGRLSHPVTVICIGPAGGYRREMPSYFDSRDTLHKMVIISRRLNRGLARARKISLLGPQKT